MLSAFAVVADERSFTKAAVRLGVSRSADQPLDAGRSRSGSGCGSSRARRERSRPRRRESACWRSCVPRSTTSRPRSPRSAGCREKPAGVVRLIAPPIVLATLVWSEAREVRPRLSRCRARHHERRRHPARPGRRPLRRRHPPRRVPPARHGRRQGDGRAARRDRRRAGVLRVTPEAEDAARPDGSPLPPVPHGHRTGPSIGGSSRSAASR